MGRVKLIVDDIDVTALASISASDISYTPAASAAVLEVGAHTVYLTVSNSASATAQSIWGFEIDEQSVYSVSITAPAKDATLKTSTTEVEVTATANKSYANRVTLNNGSHSVDAQLKWISSDTNPSAPPTAKWTATLPFNPGDNPLTATVEFADGQTRTATSRVYFDAPPIVKFTDPSDFSTFGPNNPTSPRNLSG